MRESCQRPIGSVASANEPQKEICLSSFFPCLSTGHNFRSLLFQPFAALSGRKLLCGACGVFSQDVKFAELKLVFKCREEEREGK